MRPLLAAAYLLILFALAGFVLLGQPERSRETDSGRRSRFDTQRAIEDLRGIEALTREAGGRPVGSRGNSLVREYLVKRFREAGLDVSEQPFKDIIGGAMSNVVAVLPGRGDEAILVSAHHDLEGSAPGAVGGTAGLAMLLELARTAAAEGPEEGGSRRRSLIFAAWDGDSYGSAGSSHFVETLSPRDRARLRAVVALDSVGWKDGRAVIHAMPYADKLGIRTVAPDWLILRMTNAARAAGQILPVGDLWIGPIYQVLVRAVDIGYYSDDRPFLARGVPAVFIGNFSLTNAYMKAGTGEDTIDQVGEVQLGSTGRSIEASLADLRTVPILPPGESVYLVVIPGFADAFRLTGDQAKTLGTLCLLPGAIVLLRRRRDGEFVTAGALFMAFAVVFVIMTVQDPILALVLFAPALLAAPLLAVPQRRAVWGHVASLFPSILFIVLLSPVYLSGSTRLIRIGGAELVALGSLVALGLAQLPLHLGRARSKHPLSAR